jgi:hypothetical protein
MSYEPQFDRTERKGKDPDLLESVGHDGRIFSVDDSCYHDIRIHPVKIDFEGGMVVQTLRQQFGVGMVFGESGNIVLHGIEPGGGDNSYLAHAASKQLSFPAAFFDKHGRPQRK